jgi:hypothetical protein
MRRAILAAALLAAACDSKPTGPPVFTPVLPDPATVGTIRGVVRFEGTVPEAKLEPMGGSPECSAISEGRVRTSDLLVKDGRLKNAFVYVKQGLDAKYKFPIPTEEHVVSNEKCLYTPRVSGCRTWQKIKMLNLDPTQHNFRSAEWSRTLLGKGQYAIVSFDKPAVMVALKCDLHNWMIGHLGVLDHPFFAVTGGEGAFELKGLPPGEYVVEAWHETLGTQTATVKLEPSGAAEAPFTFKR